MRERERETEIVRILNTVLPPMKFPSDSLPPKVSKTPKVPKITSQLGTFNVQGTESHFLSKPQQPSCTEEIAW